MYHRLSNKLLIRNQRNASSNAPEKRCFASERTMARRLLPLVLLAYVSFSCRRCFASERTMARRLLPLVLLAYVSFSCSEGQRAFLHFSRGKREVTAPPCVVDAVVCSAEGGEGTGPENPTFRRFIPSDYDQFQFPPSRDGGPLPVWLSAKVRDIQKIDEENMDITIEWFIRLYWRDMRLTPPAHLAKGEWENIAPDITRYVWLPTTYIDHVKEVTKPSLLVSPESFRMQNDGLIRYSISVTTRVSCPMDFSAYPFDNQVCYFKMESYQFTAKQVSYNWFDPKIGRSPKIQLGQFDFDFYSVQQQNTSHHNRSYPTVMVELVLRRRIVYHLMNTFLPSGLFVMVSWLTLLVPHHQMPARMVLTITTLLTLVSMFAGVRQETPKVSYAKAVDQWMIMCVIFVFCVLFEFTVVIFLHERGKRMAKPPQLVQERERQYNPSNPGRNAATSFTNHASFLSRNKTSAIGPAELDAGDRSQREGREEVKTEAKVTEVNVWTLWGNRVETWSPIAFPIAFIIFNIYYWTKWLSLRK
ncbi:glutamate-gated chloride channel alpha-like [Penaeus japonicus]|uniref:glutamate-gated chloride channel alpha-like n=1 Tax=Penaeus japonicus TaxID=27405 RepID=UPI001C71198F|nr:glutamate-gated chloride channel alpha-like [Penaeus japonicus]